MRVKRVACATCNRERRLDDLVYDLKTLKPYCHDSSFCQEGKEFLKPYHHLIEAIEEYYDENTAAYFEQYMYKVMSFRLSPTLLMHVAKFGQVYGTNSLNETMNKLIEKSMEDNDLDSVELVSVDWIKPKKKISNSKFVEKEKKEEGKKDDEFDWSQVKL